MRGGQQKLHLHTSQYAKFILLQLRTDERIQTTFLVNGNVGFRKEDENRRSSLKRNRNTSTSICAAEGDRPFSAQKNDDVCQMLPPILASLSQHQRQIK